MDRFEKEFFNGHMSLEEILELVECGDMQFSYKGRDYNITWDNIPCITVIGEGQQGWRDNLKTYDTYENLLLNHVFDDGVCLIDALVKDIEPI